jgi:hypothetical protein
VDTKQLKDYWILYQEGGGRDVVGELMPPVGFIPDVHNYNNAALARLLNEGNCFDFDINLRKMIVWNFIFMLPQNWKKMSGHWVVITLSRTFALNINTKTENGLMQSGIHFTII